MPPTVPAPPSCRKPCTPNPDEAVEPLQGWADLTRELAIEVMRDAATFTVDDPRFSTGQVIGPSMLSLDGDGHDATVSPSGWLSSGLFRAAPHLAIGRLGDVP